MAQPVLSVRSRGTVGNPKVFRVIGSDSTQLGNDVSASTLEGAGSRSSNPGARVIQFLGNVYLWQNNKLLRFNSGTSNWDVVHTLAQSPLYANGESHTGLWNVQIASAPLLVGVYFYNNGGTPTPVAVKFDGTTWTEVGLTGNGTGGDVSRAIVHRNVLYLVSGANFVIAYDPSVDAITFMTVAGYGASTAVDFCEYNGGLYALRSTGAASAPHKILKLIGASWSVQLTLTSTVNGAGDPETTGSYCLFTDNTHLYALLYQDNGVSNGVRCFQIDPNGNGLTLSAEITNSVITTDIRWPTPGSLPLGSVGSRWYCFIDQETLPTAITIELWFAEDHNTPYVYFEWTSNATLMTEGIAFSTAETTLAQTKYGAGDRVFTLAEMDIAIVATQPVFGGELITFKAWGDPGFSDKFVRFYFSTEDEPALQQCTLAGTATGGFSQRFGNQIQQVNADNGVTTYTIIWNGTVDGVVLDQPVVITPRISTT